MPVQPTPPFSRGFFADLLLAFLAIIIGISLSLYNDNAPTNSAIYATKMGTYFGLTIVSLIFSKSWQSVWRWTALDDLLRVSYAILGAAFAYSFFCFAYYNSLNYVEPLVTSFIMASFMMGGRGFVRMTTSGGNPRSLIALFRPVLRGAPAAILVGHTDAVSTSLHQLRKLGPLPFKPIAIVSTLGNNINKVFAGARVYDGRKPQEIIDKLVRSALSQNDEVRIVLVGDSYSEDVKNAVMNVISKTRAKISRLPEIGSKELTNVSPEEVLGRKRHHLDETGPSNLIRHKTVLITGAGGTIGSELALQVAKYGPGRLILLDSAENNLYSINLAINEQFPALNAICCMMDVREKSQIEELFKKYTPQIVLHAAANKHVPILETHPREALRVNLGGTKNVADAALKYGAQVFISISTDKAVNPSNIMGAAKRAAELYIRNCFEKNHGGFYSVRFGNVLGSSGSVMPLFERQISRMGPVTVTHFDMTRWFMTVQEAAGLVLQSAALGGGAIKDEDGLACFLSDPLLVLDMGEPVKILDFAEAMIRLRGYEPNIDIKILETGVRLGEKLHEELFYSSEHVSPTLIDGVLCARPSAPLDADLVAKIDQTLKYAEANKIDEAIALITEIVPQFDGALSRKTEYSKRGKDKAIII